MGFERRGEWLWTRSWLAKDREKGRDSQGEVLSRLRSGKKYSVGKGGGEDIRKPDGEKSALQWPWTEWTWCRERILSVTGKRWSEKDDIHTQELVCASLDRDSSPGSGPERNWGPTEIEARSTRRRLDVTQLGWEGRGRRWRRCFK